MIFLSYTKEYYIVKHKIEEKIMEFINKNKLE